MPRYDFLCRHCNRTSEVRVSHSASDNALPDKTRPCECGAAADRQFPRRTHLRFGKDFYDEAHKRGDFATP